MQPTTVVTISVVPLVVVDLIIEPTAVVTISVEPLLEQPLFPEG